MDIRSINNNYNPSMKQLYFAKYRPLFNNNFDYKKDILQKEKVLVSEKGVRYIVNDTIPESFKKKLSEVPFIKELSEKFETFVYQADICNSLSDNKLLSFIEILWINPNRKYVQSIDVFGKSEIKGLFEEFYNHEDIVEKLTNFKFKQNKKYNNYQIK